jgi:DNA-binding MarR family transcriptional regulator
MDLMFFAHSRHLRHADDELAKRGFGRAHHRVLYFLARKPDISVGDLLNILGITKQSFGRVSKALTEAGLMIQRPGDRDRRQRLLRLTDEGAALEHDIFVGLHANMSRAYAASGGEAVAGFWVVLQHLMGEEARSVFRAMQTH